LSFLFLSLALASLGPPPLSAAPPGVLPCREEALAALADIGVLLGVLDPPPAAAGALQAKLEAARESIARDNAASAQGQLGALRNQVEALARTGAIAPEDAAALLAAIEAAVSVVDTCSPVARVTFFNVRSGDSANDLYWVNPPAPFSATRILYRTDDYPAVPTDPSATVLGTFAGTPGAVGATTHGSLTNGVTYYYAAFARDAAGATAAGRTSRGRPESAAADFRWAYTIDAPRSVAAVTFTHFPAVSGDALHAMAAGAGGGGWPGGFSPVRVPAPAATRPTAIPGGTSPAVGHVAYVGTRTGRVYAVNLDTAAILWTSPDLGGPVLASISGDLFGAGPFLLFAGVRRPDGTGALVALHPATGAVAWSFDDGDALGPVTTQPSVDLGADRVYFTSRARAGADTVWCLSYTASSASLLWSADAGDVHSSPTPRRSGSGLLAIYVGNAAGEVHALHPDTGAALWPTPHDTGDGPIQQFVFPRNFTDRLYYSTVNRVRALADQGSSAQILWTTPLPAASVPLLFLGRLYVPSTDGRVFQLDEATGAIERAAGVGDPTRPPALGPATIFGTESLLTVGGADGVLYTLKIPFL
jgi:outer membrane protein assembly factor BamB